MRLHLAVIAVLANGAFASLVTLPNGLKLTGTVVKFDRSETKSDHFAIEEYQGIPFADPPTGSLRFAPPRAYSGTWTEPRLFDRVPAICPSGSTDQYQKEDCLYLTVRRPRGVDATKSLPVLVWIHGGGLMFGSTTDENTSVLAGRENMIVVSIAYRLGVYGYFASEQTLKESGTTGNWGLLDQRLALQWVKTNIGSFGGDPSRVTIGGFSAGAMSVYAHLVSPGSRGLFTAAIAVSGTSSGKFFYHQKLDSYAFTEWLVTAHTKCKSMNDMECIRNAPSSAFGLYASTSERPKWASRLYPYMPWGMTIDGVQLTDSPMRMAQLGLAVDVPVIIGVTQDDAMPWVIQAFRRLTDSNARGNRGSGNWWFVAKISGVIGAHFTGNREFSRKILKEDLPEFNKQAQAIMEKVKAFDEANPDNDALKESSQHDTQLLTAGLSSFLLLSSAARDAFFACPSFGIADALSARNKAPVYVYNFAFPYPGERYVGDYERNPVGMAHLVGRATHGADLSYIFNRYFDEKSKHRAVGDQMGCHAASLAVCGKSSCEQAKCEFEWKPWKEATGEYLEVGKDGTFKVVKVKDRQRCEAWNGLRIAFHDYTKSGTFRDIITRNIAVMDRKRNHFKRFYL